MEKREEKSVYQCFEEVFYAKQNGKEEESLQNYLMQFARKNGLSYSFDKESNVVLSTGEDGEKTTVVVLMDFRSIRPKKKWFDIKFWNGKLSRSGDYVVSNRATLCAGCLGGVAIALHMLLVGKGVQAVFIFDRNNINYAFFEAKKLNSTRVIQLVASEDDEMFLSAPAEYNCLVKFSNDKTFLANSFDLKTFKMTIFENEKTNRNLSLKLLVKFLEGVGDTKINKLYSGFFPKEEYKNEVVFTTRKPLLELKKLIKNFYSENKKKYPSLALRCVRQINQTLVLSSSQMVEFISNFKVEGDLQDVSSRIIDANSNSGFVYFDLLSKDNKAFKKMFEGIKDEVERDNAQCVCFDELKSFSNENSGFARKMIEANPTLNRKIVAGSEASLLGNIVAENKKIDALLLAYQVENRGLADERLRVSSLVNTAIFVENYLRSLESKDEQSQN